MKPKKILLSFVGTNDAGKLAGKEDGAILTSLKEEKQDIVYLLWNESKTFDYHAVVSYVRDEIINRKYAKMVNAVRCKIDDVTDHNSIYGELLTFVSTLPKGDEYIYTAAISSGTPAMQVCWILLAESGDFSEKYPLRLVRVREPRFGKPSNIEVKLDTALPRIVRMKEEIDSLTGAFLPVAKLDTKKGTMHIGNEIVVFSPVEFCYYRYFLAQRKADEEPQRFSGLYAPEGLIEKIFEYHEESYPALDVNREPLRQMIRRGSPLSMTTVRGNISKANKKIEKYCTTSEIVKYFQISSEGIRGAKYYFINLSAGKIIIV